MTTAELREVVARDSAMRLGVEDRDAFQAIPDRRALLALVRELAGEMATIDLNHVAAQRAREILAALGSGGSNGQ